MFESQRKDLNAMQLGHHLSLMTRLSVSMPSKLTENNGDQVI